MKYHVSVDCQESYIFPRDYIFPKCAALRENIVLRENIISWHHRHVIFHPFRSISVMVKINDFLIILCALRLPRSLVTRLGICAEQNKTERKLDNLRAFYYDVLLLTTAYSAYSFWVSFLIWNLCCCCCCCCCCCRLYLIVIFLRLRHFSCYNSVFDRLSMRA